MRDSRDVTVAAIFHYFLFFGDFMGITGLKKYKYKYDLHVHTSPVSTCADFSPAEAAERYACMGFDGFVLTNHFTPLGLEKHSSGKDYAEYFLNDYYETKIAGKKLGVDIILGMEIRFPENCNDYLVYGISEDDVYTCSEYLKSDYKTFYREFKSDKNIIIQAHPFRNNITLCDLDYVDGVEVFNLHPGHNSRLGIAAKLVKENPGLIITGGTDFHHEGHQGMCAMCTSKKIKSSIDLAALINSGNYIFDIWGNKIIPNNLL